MTVLLDSFCWFEYFFGSDKGEKIRSLLLSSEEVIVSSINVFEVYRKFLEKEPAGALEKKQFMCTRAKVREVNEEIASFAAELCQKHSQLHASDALIYATALKNECTLITGDKHFHKLPKAELL